MSDMSGPDSCPPKVKEWLKKLFRDKEIPPFDATPECLEMLQKLAAKNENVEKDVVKQVTEKKKLAKVYEAKAEEMKRLTSMLQLSPEIQEKVSALASLAVDLGLKEPSETNFCTALSELQYKELKLKEEKLLDDYEMKRLKRDVAKTERRIEDLKKVLDKFQKEKDLIPDLQKEIDDILKFCNAKKSDYEKRINAYEEKLLERQVDPTLYHRTLVQGNERYKKLSEDVSKLQKKLESYQGLPPNESLVALKVQETDLISEELEGEVEKLLDSCIALNMDEDSLLLSPDGRRRLSFPYQGNSRVSMSDSTLLSISESPSGLKDSASTSTDWPSQSIACSSTSGDVTQSLDFSLNSTVVPSPFTDSSVDSSMLLPQSNGDQRPSSAKDVSVLSEYPSVFLNDTQLVDLSP